MKKQLPFLTALIFTSVFIFFANGLTHAQKYSYKPLALDGAHWLCGLHDDNNPPWATTDFYQYVVRGDTIVNDIAYKKVYYRELTDQYPYLIEYEVLAGLVRDDTINQKVYAINFNFSNLWDCPENAEFLLYNFDLGIGDTMNICIVLGNDIIDNINYEFLYGVERKVLYFWENQYIEGIGSNYGVFEWGGGSKVDEKGWWFNLFDYCLGTDEECGYQWVGIDENKETPWFSIYPNPLSGNTLTLVPQTPITQPLDVKLYDITGREVYQQHFEKLTKELAIKIPEHLLPGTSPLLIWVGNSQQVYLKQLIVKQ
jgi:hypothetical protein